MSTLTDDEIERAKVALETHVLDTGAQPYFSFPAAFDVIRDHVTSSSVGPTASSTAVTAPGAVTLTLADATGFAAFQRVVLDVDDARETCTVKAVVGSTIAVNCRYTHAGTYPVQVESALTLVRGLLSDLVTLEQLERGAFADAGVKRVDEVEFFGASEGGSSLVMLARKRGDICRRLASALGVTAMYNRLRAESSGVLGAAEVY